MTLNEKEARRRISDACSLIRSAYRLETLDAKETVAMVKSAIMQGVEQQAADVADDLLNA